MAAPSVITEIEYFSAELIQPIIALEFPVKWEDISILEYPESSFRFFLLELCIYWISVEDISTLENPESCFRFFLVGNLNNSSWHHDIARVPPVSMARPRHI
jgi:hypothetical protein